MGPDDVRDPNLYDPEEEAMNHCRLTPGDEAYWGRGKLCPHHEAMRDGMELVLDWILLDDNEVER